MLTDPMIQLMRAGSFTMTIFAAVLILVVTRNIEDPRARTRAALGMVGFALLLFGFPLYGEVLGAGFFDRFGTIARVLAAIILPYGLYSLNPLDSTWGNGPSKADRDE